MGLVETGAMDSGRLDLMPSVPGKRNPSVCPLAPRVWGPYRRRLSSLTKDQASGPHSAAAWGLSRVGQGQGRGLREAAKAGLLHPGWLDHPSVHSVPHISRAW